MPGGRVLCTFGAMPYTPEEVLDFLKGLRPRERRCPECGGDERSAEPAGETSDGVFFSVRCVACGHTGLYNASELINKYGEYVGT